MSRSPDRLAMVPTASAADTALTVSEVLLPLLGRGLIVRRPPVVAAPSVSTWIGEPSGACRSCASATGPDPCCCASRDDGSR
jgi:hypothetical protein